MSMEISLFQVFNGAIGHRRRQVGRDVGEATKVRSRLYRLAPGAEPAGPRAAEIEALSDGERR